MLGVTGSELHQVGYQSKFHRRRSRTKPHKLSTRNGRLAQQQSGPLAHALTSGQQLINMRHKSVGATINSSCIIQHDKTGACMLLPRLPKRTQQLLWKIEIVSTEAQWVIIGGISQIMGKVHCVITNSSRHNKLSISSWNGDYEEQHNTDRTPVI